MLIAHCQSAQLTREPTSTRGTGWLLLLFSSLNRPVDWQAGHPKTPHLFFLYLRLPTSVPPSPINYANLCTNTYHQKRVWGRWRGEARRRRRKQTKRQIGIGMDLICQEQQLHKEYDLVSGWNRTDTQGAGQNITQPQYITDDMWCDSRLNTITPHINKAESINTKAGWCFFSVSRRNWNILLVSRPVILFYSKF